MTPSRLLLVTAALAPWLASACSRSSEGGPAGQAEASATTRAPTAGDRPFAGKTLEVFVGAASKPPTEEAVAAFARKTGAKVEAQYGGSGKMLSALKLSGRGDIYFPGSSDYMELAIREGLVDGSTEARVVYLVPAINVQRGNPRGIKSLTDLGAKGLRLGIARPDSVCVGAYAVELMEATGTTATIKPNIVTHAESCEKVAQLVALKSVDAVLGWEVFEHWDKDNIETITLPREQVTRIGYIPAAVAKSSRQPELAREFIAFLMSEEGQAIYKKWGYLTSAEEAREKYALPETPVGGEYVLPAAWK